MVMTGVQKPTKKKILNIDTRFTNEYTYPKAGFNTIENYLITLPERVTDVHAIRVKSVEIPMSFYTFSASMGNNAFRCINTGTQASSVCVLPESNLTSVSDLVVAVNQQLLASPVSNNLQLVADANGGMHFVNNALSTVYDIDFAVDACGNSDKYNFRSKLGWAMGFRDASYILVNNNTKLLYPESAPNFNTVRYMYLVVDEYSNAFPNSFLAPLHHCLMNKKILARICLYTTHYPFGSILYGNEPNGVLVSDVRTYQGKIDIQKLNVQLVNEWGMPMNLNGLDFSFALEIEHE